MANTLIAIDWGTTSLRAYRTDARGRVLAVHKGVDGIQSRKGQFEATLADVLEALEAPADAPVLMAGMIGSRQGWVEAPYLETPCDARGLARRLTKVDSGLDRPVFIVPGFCDRSGTAPDVIRGEETKLLGLLQGEGRRFETICMPGTHGKWARARDGQVLGFETYMTGEVFGLLCAHSILARLMEPNGPDDSDDWAAFDRGLRQARTGGHLLHDLFSARTLGLFDEVPATGLKSYLSGLLIGHETRAASAGRQGAVALVGDRKLTERYRRAFDHFGISCENADEDIVLTGLVAIARAAGLLESAAGA